jgi:hypothetical protein
MAHNLMDKLSKDSHHKSEEKEDPSIFDSTIHLLFTEKFGAQWPMKGKVIPESRVAMYTTSKDNLSPVTSPSS